MYVSFFLPSFFFDRHTGEQLMAWPHASSIDPMSLPIPLPASGPSYGEAYNGPVLALARPAGTFHVDLTMFKVGMPVMCQYLRGNKCYGWFLGIVNRIGDAHADIDYDDGTYDYDVPFKRLRLLSGKTKHTFQVPHLPAPEAIVLSIPHAREAVAQALQVVEAINAHFELKQNDFDHACSTPPHQSRPSTPPAIFTWCEEDDEVEFVMQWKLAGYSKTPSVRNQ